METNQISTNAGGNFEELKKISDKIRALIILSTTLAQSGHPGGSLSAADIITTLYFRKLRHDPKNPKWKYRDRFVISKGHSCPAVYSALALSGYFDINELKFLRKISFSGHEHLQGHPDALCTPGIEASTGSLGQGLSIAVGMAIAEKIGEENDEEYGKERYEIYVLLGDGECNEGQIWEAAMSASHYECDNLTAIVDRNRLQIDGSTEDVMALCPLGKKFESFGWKVLEIDGHDFEEIENAIDKPHAQNKPKVIIANTTKGKGVKFMENKAEWHGKACNFSQCIDALKDLKFIDENSEIYKNKDKEENKGKKGAEICMMLFDEISKL